ncbi:MAG: hypothetical protein K8I04_00185 [Gammaproteobacteria bacterium]|nr:hypothetical protein [Gammaproteobacteria bacterium]
MNHAIPKGLSAANAIRPMHGFLMILIAAVLVNGCATQGRDLVHDRTVTVESGPSPLATVRRVTVEQRGPDMEIRGEFSRRWPGRGPIPGHIDVSLIDRDGTALWEASLDYRRRSIKSRITVFHVKLEVEPPPGSTLRVLHHNAPIHEPTNHREAQPRG